MEDINVLKYRQFNVPKDDVSVEMVAAISSEFVNKYFSKNELFISSNLKENIYSEALNQVYWLERPFAEMDFTSKQIIPYVFLKNDNKFFVLKRKPKQSEVRLHNKLSLGIGGHINPIDFANDIDLITACLEREIKEEVLINGTFSSKFIGIINDNNSEVGKVHIGFVFEASLSSDQVEINEKDKMDGDWQTLDEILLNYDFMESWSQIVIDEYLSRNKN